MAESLYSPPDPFTLAPLLALLPVRGRIGALDALTNSLYARYEKVKQLQEEAVKAEDRENYRRLSSEQAMLKQVLEWLQIHPEESV